MPAEIRLMPAALKFEQARSSRVWNGSFKGSAEKGEHFMPEKVVSINPGIRRAEAVSEDPPQCQLHTSEISLNRWQYRRLMEVWWGMEPVLELIRSDEVCDPQAVYYILKPFVRELGSVLMELDESLEDLDSRQAESGEEEHA